MRKLLRILILKINYKIIILFSIIIIIIVGSVSYISFQSLEYAVINSELSEMQSQVRLKANLINTLHSRASEDLLFAVKNPAFVEYFELPETRADNIYSDEGVMQFTNNQRTIKNELDQWIYEFQKKFHIDETCLIDHTGQEHTRLVLTDIAPDEDLSSEENASPFFTPSFNANKNEVYIQSPYVSPDTERWVFAYTTPIILSDGSKPSFYHFEMPVSIFQDIVKADVGRMYVVDSNGLLISDSGHQYPSDTGSAVFGQSPSEYFPSAYAAISDSQDLAKAINAMNQLGVEAEGIATYFEGEEYYLAFKKLPTFGWTLVYEKPYSLMLAGDTNLGQLGTNIGILSAIIAGAGLVVAFIVSSRISRPIHELSRVLLDQEPNKLKTINVTQTKDEVSEVTNAVNEMISRIHTLEKQKDEFASMVTHELRSPLTPIIGWCQTLRNPKIMGSHLTEKQLTAVDSIQRNAKRLQQLIGDILDAQKLDLNKLKVEFNEINVNELISIVHTNLQEAMKPKRINFVNTTSENETITVVGDRNRLEQVMNNLILNAVDFVPEERGMIEIGAQKSRGEVIIHVKDNGTGIPADKQKYLFKKFYQVDTTVTRKHGGSGLGLVISKGIVEALGGRIWVESEKEKGTTFYFTIPETRTVRQENEVKAK